MENQEKTFTKGSTTISAFFTSRKKRVIQIGIITVLVMVFMSSCLSQTGLIGTTQRVFTRMQIEALQYEFEFILPYEARIVHFSWVNPAREAEEITVSIAGIRYLDDFLENNLLFELATPGHISDFGAYSRYLRRNSDSTIVYSAAPGSRIETRGQFVGEHLSRHRQFRRSVRVFSIDDSETVIVEISQRSSIESSPYRQTFNRMIAVNAPFQLFKRWLRVD